MVESPATQLFRACQIGTYDAVQTVLDSQKGLKLDAQDEFGRTALHLICEVGNLSVIELLFSRGISVHSRDKWGRTPLHYACLSNKKDVVSLIIKRQADINAASADLSTPLHICALYDKSDAAHELLTNGADPNVMDIQNRSPLYIATGKGNLVILELLLQSGALVDCSSIVRVNPPSLESGEALIQPGILTVGVGGDAKSSAFLSNFGITSNDSDNSFNSLYPTFYNSNKRNTVSDGTNSAQEATEAFLRLLSKYAPGWVLPFVRDSNRLSVANALSILRDEHVHLLGTGALLERAKVYKNALDSMLLALEESAVVLNSALYEACSRLFREETTPYHSDPHASTKLPRSMTSVPLSASKSTRIMRTQSSSSMSASSIVSQTLSQDELRHLLRSLADRQGTEDIHKYGSRATQSGIEGDNKSLSLSDFTPLPVPAASICEELCPAQWNVFQRSLEFVREFCIRRSVRTRASGNVGGSSVSNGGSVDDDEDALDAVDSRWFQFLDAVLGLGVTIHVLDPLFMIQSQVDSEKMSISFTSTSSGIHNMYSEYGRGLMSLVIRECTTSILGSMSNHVTLKKILTKLLSDHSTATFGDVKDTILSMVGTYSYEHKLLEITTHLLQDTVVKSMHSLLSAASKALAPSVTAKTAALQAGSYSRHRVPACPHCMGPLSASALTASESQSGAAAMSGLAGAAAQGTGVVVVFACGHALHQECVVNGTCGLCISRGFSGNNPNGKGYEEDEEDDEIDPDNLDMDPEAKFNNSSDSDPLAGNMGGTGAVHSLISPGLINFNFGVSTKNAKNSKAKISKDGNPFGTTEAGADDDAGEDYDDYADDMVGAGNPFASSSGNNPNRNRSKSRVNIQSPSKNSFTLDNDIFGLDSAEDEKSVHAERLAALRNRRRKTKSLTYYADILAK